MLKREIKDQTSSEACNDAGSTGTRWQPFPAVVPLPRAGSYALLTRPPLETPLPVRLACVKHAASVHPEPGSNSP
ncbi:hypothetical protein DCAR_0934464 [Daucus carota subsp. sativus]|uniref:Uncharacterized protein n=1 Tax=Daucus carota subsp. sativus TaxID=79200 RepID=A0AAF0XXX8_DAUCS|nr:hypothetical protein DCAR_0934464 [Daucus carota subsp. sativus]